jgi:GNAT superfamily N-acetyltransferase
VEVRLHDDVEEFAALARPLLHADPVRNTLALTVLERLRRGDEDGGWLISVHAGGVLRGVALQNPDRPLVVSALPVECAAPVDAALAAAGRDPTGVTGPTARAEAFAAARAARTGERVRVVFRLRLFALAELVVPSGIRGRARPGAARDADLVAEWISAFAAEALGERSERPRRPGPAPAPEPGLTLWEVDGEPLALASARAPTAAMTRIGPVYTPPAARGHGYGTAVTAAAAAWALAAGARYVVLFTDLAYPVSNKIYPRIGFRPVGDAAELTFAGGEAGSVP